MTNKELTPKTSPKTQYQKSKQYNSLSAHTSYYQKSKQYNKKIGQKELKRHFSKDLQMANRHMKRCSISLITTEMKVKTILRCHLISVRMAIINKKINNKCWRWCGEKRTLTYCWWKCKLVVALWKKVWRFLRKLKIELPYDPAIPLLGTFPNKTICQEDSCIPMFIAALFSITKIWTQTKCPSSEEWITIQQNTTQL